jgi:hypothetical protein
MRIGRFHERKHGCFSILPKRDLYADSSPACGRAIAESCGAAAWRLRFRKAQEKMLRRRCITGCNAGIRIEMEYLKKTVWLRSAVRMILSSVQV